MVVLPIIRSLSRECSRKYYVSALRVWLSYQNTAAVNEQVDIKCVGHNIALILLCLSQNHHYDYIRFINTKYEFKKESSDIEGALKKMKRVGSTLGEQITTYF